MKAKINLGASRRYIRKITSLATIAALVGAAIFPILSSNRAEAAQMTSRKITLGSSQVSKTDVTYTLQFTTATTSNVGGLVVEFCSNSPIIGNATCTAPTGFDVNEAGLALGTQVGITGFTMDGTATITNKLVLTRSVTSINSAVAVTLPFGAGGASDGFTNPSTNGTFYARVLTFATSGGATGYSSGTPGTYVDGGGIAMSTANQLTITARVQEVLQFCVGTTLANDGVVGTQCSDMSGTSIDLGVVDSASVTTSATDAGKAMVRTNAVNGVAITYFSELNTSSGALKVAGATCGAVPSVTGTDQCFNTSAVGSALATGTEEFGMTINAVDGSNGTTTNLTTLDADYTSSNYAWQATGAVESLASSSTVVDDEMLELRFSAAAAATTPTGQYTVTATFVATGTF